MMRVARLRVLAPPHCDEGMDAHPQQPQAKVPTTTPLSLVPTTTPLSLLPVSSQVAMMVRAHEPPRQGGARTHAQVPLQP